MRKLILAALYVVSLTGFLYLLLSQKNPYQWMGEIDPEFSQSVIEDASGNGVVVAALAVAAIWLCQAGVAWTSKGAHRVLAPIIISVLAGVLWIVKFN